MSEANPAIRLVSVAVFVLAGVIALFGAAGAAAEEAYITWSDSQPLGLTIFGGANVIAAALAARRGGSIGTRWLGMLSLVPAGLLMNASDSTPGDAKWLILGLAASLVLLGGLCCGRLGKVSGGSRR